MSSVECIWIETQSVHPPGEDTVIALGKSLTLSTLPSRALADFNCAENMIRAGIKLNTESKLNKLYIMGFGGFFLDVSCSTGMQSTNWAKTQSWNATKVSHDHDIWSKEHKKKKKIQNYRCFKLHIYIIIIII